MGFDRIAVVGSRHGLNGLNGLFVVTSFFKTTNDTKENVGNTQLIGENL